MQPTDPSPAATGLPLGVGGVYAQGIGEQASWWQYAMPRRTQMGAYRDVSGQEETTGGIYKNT